MEIFSDMKFWAVLISLVSLCVSLYPSVRERIKGAKLNIEIHSTIAVSHKYGLTNVQWNITLINTGGLDIRIKGISLKLIRNGRIVELPARSYYKSTDSITPIMFTSLKLKSGEEVAHNYVFFPYLDRKDERLIRELESKAKIETAPDMAMFGPPKSLSQDTYDQLHEFYKHNFDLKHGEYQLELHVKTHPIAKVSDQKFRFTVFEGDEEDLRNTTTGYKTGAGVCTPAIGTVWFNIPLQPMSPA